jgi:hypothetical protein
MATSASISQVPPPARAELAPTGKLRAGINYGNVILAKKDKATGESSGVAIDLLVSGQVEALAGSRQALIAPAAKLP